MQETPDPLDQKAAEILDSIGEKKFELPDPPSSEELDARIKAATGKSPDQIQQQRSAEKNIKAAVEKDTQAYYRSTSVGLSVAYGLLAIPCAFMALAWALRKFASVGDPWYGLIILAGVLLGFYVTVKRLNVLNS